MNYEKTCGCDAGHGHTLRLRCWSFGGATSLPLVSIAVCAATIVEVTIVKSSPPSIIDSQAGLCTSRSDFSSRVLSAWDSCLRACHGFFNEKRKTMFREILFAVLVVAAYAGCVQSRSSSNEKPLPHG